MIIGLTGRIAAGKSEAASYLAHTYKYCLFDADKEVAYLRKDPDIQAKILKAFPTAADNNGTLCREQLRHIVFKDSMALRTLEGILFPALLAEANDFTTLMTKRGTHGLIDAPLLFRAGLESYCDHIIMIRTDKGIRRKRYASRQGVQPQDFDRIDASQQDIDKHAKDMSLIIDGGLPLNTIHEKLQQFISPLHAS